MNVKSQSEPDSKRFAELMRDMRSGSDDAAWELLELYGPHIKAVVRKSLGGKLRAMYDSSDFVQSVWASLIRAEHDFKHVNNPKNFVLAIARNKIVDEIRKRRQSTKHDISREVPIDAVPEVDLADDAPRASEWAQAKERWDSIMTDENEIGRQVIQLRVAGYKIDDIAETLDISERTVRRIIKRVLDRQES